MGALFAVTNLELHIRKTTAKENAAIVHLSFSTYAEHLTSQRCSGPPRRRDEVRYQAVAAIGATYAAIDEWH